MSESSMDLERYLDRIGFTGNASVSEDTLYQLHLAHTTTVPFENLDVFYKKPILLDEASLFNKLVNNQRGGYCFEMNGVFSIVLQKLGFKVTNLLARGVMGDLGYTAKTHQALMVEIDGTSWLADVGYGNEGIMAPLVMEPINDQIQFAHTYRLVEDPIFDFILQKKDNSGEFRDLYAFNLTACYPVDFLMSNHFTSTYHESFFTKMRMITMPTKKGRITLTDQHFKRVEDGETREEPIQSEEEFQQILKDIFQLDLESIKRNADQ